MQRSDLQQRARMQGFAVAGQQQTETMNLDVAIAANLKDLGYDA
jgi:hypothetical protein